MNTIKISIDNLFLDPNNYRLRSNPHYAEIPDLTDNKLIGRAVQLRTSNLISGKNNFEIKDLIDSFKSNGYLKVDNILVKKLEGDLGFVVIEGNRRVAALKVLQKSFEEGFDIGILRDDIFKNPTENPNYGIEVVLYDYNKPEDYLILMGLRHVSGNKKWDRYNQAKLIAELYEKKYSISEIANKLGISNKNSVQQQLDAYYAINAFINDKESYDEDVDYNPHERFMIFVEVLLKSKVKNWLGWNNQIKKFTDEKNLKRFYSWITPSFFNNTEDDEEEAYDFNSNEMSQPIIVNHKEIRILSEIIDDEESLMRMEETRDIHEALEQNEGYTQKKFTKELKRAEIILKNMKFGPSLTLDAEDNATLKNILRITNRILGENDEG